MKRILLLLALTQMHMTSYAQKSETEFKAERISRSSTLSIHAPIEKVFPLFGPLLEMEWAAGWEPRVIYLDQKNVAEHMIFQTKSHYGNDYLWAVTQYEAEHFKIEYTVQTPGRIWFIRVQCSPDDKETKATVTYTYTGLTEKGNRENKEALEKMFSKDLKDWEEAINYYLKTGEQLH
jgi:hypothetical protein